MGQAYSPKSTNQTRLTPITLTNLFVIVLENIASDFFTWRQ
ncbi:hypothetical protein [Streptococcus mutans]|nr:hypothetical protein [Streptococcus mutans]UVT93025.1 hypothetical protein NPS18_03820 [Streptococcus mutans]